MALVQTTLVRMLLVQMTMARMMLVQTMIARMTLAQNNIITLRLIMPFGSGIISLKDSSQNFVRFYRP